MTIRLDVKVGDKYNKLTILKEVEPHVYPSGETRRNFLVQCDCGSEPKTVLINGLRSGKTKSCGCHNATKTKTHGMHKTRQYQTWADMKTRCDNKDHKSYMDYGGRGISYDPRWAKFEVFWDDMQDTYSDDLTLNRRDNDGNYCKENCAWDDKHFQGHMRRKQPRTLFAEVGISESGVDKYSANIKYEGGKLWLGAYNTTAEASEAYDTASELLYGDRPNKTKSTRDSVLKNVMYYYDNRNILLQKPKGEDNHASKLNNTEVLEIIKLLDEGVLTGEEIAQLYGVKQCAVSSIHTGKTWSWLTGRVYNRKTRVS